MKIAVIGSGALGGTYGGRMALAGADVTLFDVWQAHVDAIQSDGLRISGVPGECCARLAASCDTTGQGPFDLAIVATDANNTVAAAKTASSMLNSSGFAMPLQNGIGNVEALVAELGRERVIGGSSMSSFAVVTAGHVVQTHAGPTTIGELDGGGSTRIELVKQALQAAGFEVQVAGDIMATIWQKFLVNVAINPLCAATGLRLGEVARNAAVNEFQDRILDEALAVTAAKGIAIPDPDIRATIKRHCWSKYSRPSMLQHVDAGRRTEIDALNGALVREAKALGIAVPFNEALTALVKGREEACMTAIREPDRDYDAMEEAIGPMPGAA